MGLIAMIIQNQRSITRSPGLFCERVIKMIIVRAIAANDPTMREIVFLDIPASSKAVRVQALHVIHSRGQRYCLCSDQVGDKKKDDSRKMSPELRFSNR